MNRALGYFTAIIGLIGLTASLFPEFKDYLSSSLSISTSQITNTYLMIGSVVIIIVAILLVMKSGRRGKTQIPREVPIFHGNKIVGYRRHY